MRPRPRPPLVSPRMAERLRIVARLAPAFAPLCLLAGVGLAQEPQAAAPEPLAPEARLAALKAQAEADAARIAELEAALSEARRALETLRGRGLNQTLEEDQTDLALRACEGRVEAAERAEAAAERAAADAEREVRSLETRLRSAEAGERRAENEARNLRLRARRCP